MKLSYRGVNYEYYPQTLEVTEGEILGKYRGIGWHCHTLNEVPVPQPDATLKYRGVVYNPSRAAEACTAANNQVGRSRAIKAIGQLTQPVVQKTSQEVHKENLKRHLERRLQAAKDRGDQNLISLLEAESRQLLV